jgi:sarcosine oxidase delta subunit
MCGPCPHCGKEILDLLTEMVPDAHKRNKDFVNLQFMKPGAAITCPYCHESIEFGDRGQLRKSEKEPLRYSKEKFDMRTQMEGLDSHAEFMDKIRGMPGAMKNYTYAEDHAHENEPQRAAVS